MALLCFDLDGTLWDPLEAVHACLRSACEGTGVPCPDRHRIAGTIGLDLEALFPELPGPRRRELLEHYRRRLEEEGLFSLRILAGAHLLLARLKRQGHRLHVVTSEPTRLTRRALHHFDLLLAFDGVTGLEPLESWQPKARMLERLRRDGVLASGGYLIGDRADDMHAAKAHGLKAVGVSYGYGTPGELEDAGAEVVLDSIQTLDAWLGEELREPEIHDPFSRSE